MIELFYITNDPDEVRIVDRLGIDWLFVDLEYIGKNERQLGRDTVLSNHSFDDIDALAVVIRNSRLMVRSNPIGAWSQQEFEEINKRSNIIDMVMLPYFKSTSEVESYLELLDLNEIKPALLIETMDAVRHIEDILSLYPFEYIHIGLNDLHIERRTGSMFEPYVDGLLENIASILRKRGQKFGIGGIGKIGDKLFPTPECVLIEQLRLKSRGVILSRSFKGKFDSSLKETFESDLSHAVANLRRQETLAKFLSKSELLENYSLMEAQIEDAK